MIATGVDATKENNSGQLPRHQGVRKSSGAFFNILDDLSGQDTCSTFLIQLMHDKSIVQLV